MSYVFIDARIYSIFSNSLFFFSKKKCKLVEAFDKKGFFFSFKSLKSLVLNEPVVLHPSTLFKGH